MNTVSPATDHRHSLARRRDLRLELRAEIDGLEFCWVTKDVSAGGFLAFADAPPSIGTRFCFRIVTAETEIHGEAKVMRYEPAQGRPYGFGARFCAIHGDGRVQIARLLHEAGRAE